MRQCNIYSDSKGIPLALFLCFILLSLSGCAKKIPSQSLPAVTPPHGEMSINEYLSWLDSIKTVKFLFSIKVNRQGEEISGNASMLINGDDTSGGETVLRIYSLGFLISEIRLSDGKIITEGKNLSPEKAYLLIEALRSCLLWWKMEAREVERTDNFIVVRNSWRKVYMNKDYIPYRQEIHLPHVPSVVINYERPEFYSYGVTPPPEDKEFKKGIWFPSLITVRLQGNEISLHVEKIVTQN